MVKSMLIVAVILAVVPAMGQKHPLPPKPHCANHSEVYAPACPRLRKGYCKGDFQLCDMG